ncbi:LPS assembly lipoprotein LptE [Propionivibrio sp.]|uniref:LPS-assembly lipoprotein LptE n=1 Tax=Propionivibrio sp. TaxID=2212460 RepID=UPI003BF09A65
MRVLLHSVVVILVLLLSACGFQLRGAYTLPFESLYLGVPDTSLIGAGLKRQIRASGAVRLVDTPKEAQASFYMTYDAREPVILSFSGSGNVREKRLYYRFGYRVVDSKGLNLIVPGMIELSRDLTYADSAVLAKTQEEELLWRDMESDVVQQLMRRLSAAKPMPPPAIE